jgi:CBS-domain-containing membrane protein
MTTPVITARVRWPVAQAASLMRNHQVTALPVVDAHNRLIGIVSDADVLAEAPQPSPASIDKPPRLRAVERP